jgi:hypothetical protein
MPQPESILSMTLCVFAPLCEIPGFYARAGSSKGGSKEDARRRTYPLALPEKMVPERVLTRHKTQHRPGLALKHWDRLAVERDVLRLLVLIARQLHPTLRHVSPTHWSSHSVLFRVHL